MTLPALLASMIPVYDACYRAYVNEAYQEADW